MTMNRYTFISKTSGKPAKIRGAKTREEARLRKAFTPRDVVIYDRVKQRVVR